MSDDRFPNGATIVRNNVRGHILRCVWLIAWETHAPTARAYEVQFDDGRRLIVLASEVART